MMSHSPPRHPNPLKPDSLPCGCRRCGCVCHAHSGTGREEPCNQHATWIVTRFVAGEVATLIVLALFIGMISIWGAIFARL